LIRRNGSPVSGDCLALFAAREVKGRKAKSGYPVKKLVFNGLEHPAKAGCFFGCAQWNIEYIPAFL